MISKKGFMYITNNRQIIRKDFRNKHYIYHNTVTPEGIPVTLISKFTNYGNACQDHVNTVYLLI